MTACPREVGKTWQMGVLNAGPSDSGCCPGIRCCVSALMTSSARVPTFLSRSWLTELKPGPNKPGSGQPPAKKCLRLEKQRWWDTRTRACTHICTYMYTQTNKCKKVKGKDNCNCASLPAGVAFCAQPNRGRTLRVKVDGDSQALCGETILATRLYNVSLSMHGKAAEATLTQRLKQTFQSLSVMLAV